MKLLHDREATWFLAHRGIARVSRRLNEGSEEARAMVERIQHWDEMGHDPTYHVTVLTSTDCNLACPYCFQNTAAPPEGSVVSPRIAANRMNQDVARRCSKPRTLPKHLLREPLLLVGIQLPPRLLSRDECLEFVPGSALWDGC